jgi:hypothetical protein
MASRRRWPGCAANGYVARMRLALSCAAASSTVAVARAAERATIVRAGVALCCALLLGGCESYVGARATTVHGKHGHKTCAQLLAEHKSISDRISELNGLISKAEQEAAGAFIGAAVYGPTLGRARAERRILDEAIEEKRCR